mmetsp:Transcript_9815/g.12151  ORF Transcript_9815/g.12151 Transcript_9815/m.12151 type:complete len:476 (+) Transcript_9815:387-1814(+)
MEVILRLLLAASNDVSHERLHTRVRLLPRVGGLGAVHAAGVLQLREHLLDGLLVIVTNVGLLFLVRVNFGLGNIGLVELLVPDLLDGGDVVVAEVEPALHSGALLDALLGHVLVIVAVEVVESLLRDVAQLEGDLDDLADVGARADTSGAEMEVGVALELLTDEILHRLEVLLVEGLTHGVENENSLLVGDRAEGKSARHEEHRLDDFLAQDVVEAGLLADGAASSQYAHHRAQLFHGTDAEHARLGHDRLRLVPVRLADVAAAQQHQAVVGQVLEVAEHGVESLLLAIFEKADVLLSELLDELSEEVERVWLVLLVRIRAAYDIHDALDDLRLRQDLEESLILTELAKSGARVKRHVQVVVLVGKFVDEGADDHGGLLFQDLLHALLVGGELGLGVVAILVAVVARLPLVLNLWLDLLLYQLDHEGSERVLVEVAEETVEDLSLLVEKQILEGGQLLLVEHLLQNLGEVAAQDR